MNTNEIHIHLGVVILGAGASVRMGRPKLLLPWRDTTVIGQITSTWNELGAAQIGVVMRPNNAGLEAELERLKFPRANHIKNPEPERGMFSSILCAAKWTGWRNDISHWAIVLGDQPHLTAKCLQQLLIFAAKNADKICQPMFNGQAAHPVVLPRAFFEALKTTKLGTLKDFLKLMAQSCVQLEINEASLLLDLDTPEDYIRFQAS